MRSSLRRTCLVACLAFACAQNRAAGPIMGCEAVGNARPVCGFQNPEDLAALPGGAAILASEYGGMQGEKPGDLALFVLASDERRVIFRGADAATKPTRGWGDAACPGPPTGGTISPHGIDLAPRPDGRLALAVVQHAGRDSIELFEVSGSGTDWKLAWRGCVVVPPDAWPNDVVLLPDGSLIFSSMMPRSEGLERMMKADASSGMAMRWNASEGFHEIPGTRGALDNGVVVSPDGKKLFLNLTRDNEVRRIDLASGKVEATAKVLGPDNSTWAPDGKLLVASIRSMGQGDFKVCEHVPPGACPIPFAIVAVDPVTLETRDLYASNGPPGGLGTVGLQVGHEIFVGSASSDRVLRVKLGTE